VSRELATIRPLIGARGIGVLVAHGWASPGQAHSAVDWLCHATARVPRAFRRVPRRPGPAVVPVVMPDHRPMMALRLGPGTQEVW